MFTIMPKLTVYQFLHLWKTLLFKKTKTNEQTTCVRASSSFLLDNLPLCDTPKEFTNRPFSPPQILKKSFYVWFEKTTFLLQHRNFLSACATAVLVTEDLASSGTVFPRRNACYRCTALPVAAGQDCLYLS